MPLASAKFILIHTHNVEHIFHQVSHTVTHAAKPVEKPIEQPIKATKQINKVVAPVEKTGEDAEKTMAQVSNKDADSIEKISSDVGKAGETAGKAIAQVPNEDAESVEEMSSDVGKAGETAGKAIAQVSNKDADSIEKISSDMGKAGEDAQKAMEQVPGDINTFGAGMTNAIQNPADGAKTFMINDGGDDLVTHAGNQDSQDHEAGTNTVKWGDSKKGKQEMENAISTTIQCGESFIPIYGTVQTLSQIGQYNDTEVCAALGAANDLDDPAAESAEAILETLSD